MTVSQRPQRPQRLQRPQRPQRPQRSQTGAKPESQVPSPPSTAPSKGVVHRLAWFSLVLILLALLNSVVDERADPVALARVSLALCAACWLLVLRAYGWNYLAAPFVYLVLLTLFHFGLIWTWGFGGEGVVLSLSGSMSRWMTGADLYLASYLSAVWVAVFAVVASFLGVATRPILEDRWAMRRREEVTSLTGLIVEIIGLGAFLIAFLRAGGLGLIGGSYGLFLENAQDASTAYGLWALSLGFNLSQLGSRRTRRVGLTTFAVFAAIAFPLGMRGTVLFTLICGLVARRIRGLRTPALPLALGAAVFAVLSAVVRVTRGGGESGGGWLSGLSETVAEMGFSIKPVLVIINYRELGGSDTGFVSLVAVPLRLMESILGTSGAGPDFRLFNVKMMTLAGPIGGSPVAEGLDALGFTGVILMAVALALLIAAPYRRAIAGQLPPAYFLAVFSPALATVRNSMAPLVVQIALGAAVVWFSRRLAVDDAEP